MALNRVVIIGRITNDIEVKQTTNGTACAQFTVAVDRGYKDDSGEYPTDFINCVAWRQTAEFLGRYFSKGRMISVEGQLRTRTYEDKNGTKHYVTEVYADAVGFCGDKPNNNGNNGGFGGFGG